MHHSSPSITDELKEQMPSFNAARIVGAGKASSVGMEIARSAYGTPKSLVVAQCNGATSRPYNIKL